MLETQGEFHEAQGGRGVGSQLILDNFGAGSVVATDLDESMLALASRSLARYGARARLVQRKVLFFGDFLIGVG